MPQNIKHNPFTFIYRADCTTCEKYVGPKRKSKYEAEADGEDHKALPNNEDHIVKIEVTQSYYII
ncbi:hypothetical protein [Pedobacter soli]|uniref:Uncharacterized protein n=1 Tax=Pedobacter soli TaxID=390242 RepID=A0A1G6Y8L8_9SPHI|nr:hypothetical protein [Pedobacter soli]SDD85915.1 hypothetical protein SAMN04488024_108173 [Pedobacter soli]